MKRDHKAIGIRIKKLGITQVHVAKHFKMHKITLAHIIAGNEKYAKKETIEKIHKYLDTVIT